MVSVILFVAGVVVGVYADKIPLLSKLVAKLRGTTTEPPTAS